MCAQYRIASDMKKLARRYGIQLPFDPVDYTDHIAPHLFAPVIVKERGELCFKKMNFSLIPNWSKERRPKFATHNARIEDIEAKPTWREPFRKNHCIIPMTKFIEPIYKNEHAGWMVSFKRSDENEMFAAGLYDQWVDRATGEVVDSFTIITGEPLPLVKTVGHDRSPFFIKDSSWNEWLDVKPQDALETKKQLQTHREEPDVQVERDRQMRPGWEKRR
jgi:putative SOS response-associated peptidase YedK